MSRPFTVDLSDYYGQPDFREQDSSTIVDRRKMLNLHKKLDAGKAKEVGPRVPRSRKGTTRTRKGAGTGPSVPSGATNCKPSGGAVAFNNADAALPLAEHTGSAAPAKAGAIAFNNAGTGGALAFNEQQLMNELTGLKKGGALGTVAATVIPALIQMAP